MGQAIPMTKGGNLRRKIFFEKCRNDKGYKYSEKRPFFSSKNGPPYISYKKSFESRFRDKYNIVFYPRNNKFSKKIHRGTQSEELWTKYDFVDKP